MKHQIVGSDMQAIVCDMERGEKLVAETGHVLSMTSALDFDTTASGGLMGGLMRAIGGSSFFMNEIVARDAGRVVFASPSPGKVQELAVSSAKSWLCQPHVFLCAGGDVRLSAAMTQSLGAGLFGGAGFVLQTIEGAGQAFIHVAGAAIVHDLQAGETLRVETGSLAAFESTIAYDIQLVGGLKSILFSGEGIWFATLRGPGRVYLQSLALPRLAHALARYLPTVERTSESGVAGGIIGSIIKNSF
jgi:uncharacterized protein (TIGR00266 family)